MRVVLLIAACVLLAACGDQIMDDANGATAVADIGQMLADGDANVCVNLDVQATAVAISGNSFYADYLTKGGMPIAFTAVNASKIDKDLREVGCKATLEPAEGVTLIEPMLLEYAVRPALGSEGGFVVEVPNKSALQEWVSAWLITNPNKPTSRQVQQQSEEGQAAPEISEETIAEVDQEKADVTPMEFPAGLSAEEKTLYEELNTKCRGGSGDVRETWEYCAQRDAMWKR